MLLQRVDRHIATILSDFQQARELSDHWRNERLAEVLLWAALDERLAALREDNLIEEFPRQIGTRLWNAAGEEFMAKGWLCRRAYEKPRGYPGDYALLGAIVEQTVTDDPCGQHFDRYFLHQAAPLAVVARTRLATQVIVAEAMTRFAASGRPEPLHVMSVGSGPALECVAAIEALPPENRDKLQFTLVDFDPEALDVASANLTSLLPAERVQTVQCAATKIAARPKLAEKFPTGDLIICTGLFDYLDDAAAAAMLALFWKRLNPRGRMLVGQFAPHNSTKIFMEFVTAWYLTYRTTEELSLLVQGAGIPRNACRITSEATGVDLFIDARKP